MHERILANPEAAVEWLRAGSLDAPTPTTMLFVCELLSKNIVESFAPLGRRGPIVERKRRGSLTAGSAAAATTSLDTPRVPGLISTLAAIPNLVQVQIDDDRTDAF